MTPFVRFSRYLEFRIDTYSIDIKKYLLSRIIQYYFSLYSLDLEL